MSAISHSTPSAPAHTEAHPHHEDLSFLRKFIFSTDHKTIGIQYAVTGLIFLFLGFCLMIMMRWQIAYPNQPVPLVGGLLHWALGDPALNGIITPDLYNSFGA